VLLTMHAWGSKHLYGAECAGVGFIHKTCGHELEPTLACSHCGEEVHRRDLELKVEPNRPTVGDVLAKDEAAA
jgi:hypothetical protein